MNARRRRPWHLILLIISQLLLFNIFAQPVEQETTTERLSTEIDYNEIKDDLKNKLIAIDKLKIASGRVVGRSDFSVSGNQTKESLQELKDRYSVLLANVTQLSQQIQNYKIDVFDSKSMLDLLESDISELFERGHEELLKNNQLAVGEVFDNSITEHLELLSSLREVIKELQRVNNNRELKFEHLFLHALLNGQYDLAAVKLNSVKHDRHALSLLNAAYLKQKHIDGILYLGSIVSDYKRRLLIFKTVYSKVMKNNKSDVCDLLKLIDTINKELPEILANDRVTFKQLFSLKIQAESATLVRTEQTVHNSSGDVFIRHQDFRNFIVYTKHYKNYQLLHSITYTVTSDPTNKEVIRCSHVKL